MDEWMGGWMNGWMDEWMDHEAQWGAQGLPLASQSNQGTLWPWTWT